MRSGYGNAVRLKILPTQFPKIQFLLSEYILVILDDEVTDLTKIVIFAII